MASACLEAKGITGPPRIIRKELIFFVEELFLGKSYILGRDFFWERLFFSFRRGKFLKF
jgi:hypothetical protein